MSKVGGDDVIHPPSVHAKKKKRKQTNHALSVFHSLHPPFEYTPPPLHLLPSSLSLILLIFAAPSLRWMNRHRNMAYAMTSQQLLLLFVYVFLCLSTGCRIKKKGVSRETEREQEREGGSENRRAKRRREGLTCL